jgi:hypothetical protein
MFPNGKMPFGRIDRRYLNLYPSGGATAFTFYKALRALALYLLYRYFYVVVKAGYIKGLRVNAVALPLIVVRL